MRKTIFTASIIAACGFALSTNAQSAQGRAQIGDTSANVNVQTNDDKNDWQNQRSYNNQSTQSSQNSQTRHSSQSSGVQPANKASSIIGMEVVNQNQESLGEIKDVVIDLNSGRVSYAVLGVGGILGIGEKMIAIPPSAFSTAQENDKLTLRADRERLRQAPGFTDENWPDAQNPSWGASAFWTEDSQRNQQQSNRRQSDYDQSGASQNYGQTSQFDRYNQSQNRNQTSNRDFNYDDDQDDSWSRQSDYRTSNPQRYNQNQGQQYDRQSNQQRYNQNQGQQYDRQSNQQRYNTSTPNRQSQFDSTTDSFRDEDRGYRGDTSDRGYNQNRSQYQNQNRDTFNNQQQYRTQSRFQSGGDNNYDSDRNRSYQAGRDQSSNYNRQTRDRGMDEWNQGQRQALDRYRYTTDDRFNTDADADWQPDSDYEPGRSDTRYNNQNTTGQRYRTTTTNDSSNRDYDNARTALERHNVESDADYRPTTPNRQVGTARYSDDRSYQSTQRNQQRYDAQDRERGEDKIARTELTTARGEIVEIDSEKKTMTVRTNDGQRKEFSFTDTPTINIPGNNNALLVDLKPGYSVRVGYHDDDQGKACAHVITQTGATDIR